MRIRTCRRRIMIVCACVSVTTTIMFLMYAPQDAWTKQHIDLSYTGTAEKRAQVDHFQRLLPVTLPRLVSLKQQAKVRWNYGILNRTKILHKLDKIRTPRFRKESCLTEFGFNICISEASPLKRRLPIKRAHGCSIKKYPAHLPLVSLIIPLVNEHWHTTLRMLYSLAQSTQRELLQEIILVHSEKSTDFASQLKENCQQHAKDLPMKTVSCAEGDYSMYKLEGALAAVGEVLVFLSPRMEFVSDWLPPLLEPLVLDQRKATTPHVDIIDPVTDERAPISTRRRTMFDWKLRIRHFHVDEETENLDDAFETPVLSSEVFAIRGNFYWELGGHDGTLSEIHAATLDLSFKIWLCGGSISAVPCSHCTYIDPNTNSHRRNAQQLLDYRHVAARWMDEYQRMVYAQKPSFHKLSPGNITGHQDQKDEMACRPFRWYLEKVAHEVLRQFPIISKPLASGLLKNPACGRCLTIGYSNAGIGTCEPDDEDKSLRFERNGELTALSTDGHPHCLAMYRPEQEMIIPDSLLSVAVDSKTEYISYEWRYNLENEQLMIYPYQYCIEVQNDCQQILLIACDRKSSRQRWQFSNIDKEAVLRHYTYGDDGGV